MWLCTRRLQAGSFAWPREGVDTSAGTLDLTREQFDWLVAGLPWQRLGAPEPQPITAV
jgi:transposase